MEIVADSARTVAEALDLDPRTVDDVVLAAELHDLGKLALPQSIVHKPFALDESATSRASCARVTSE